MNFEKPSFTTIIEHGNTLVFTSSLMLAERLAMVMITANPSPVEMVIKVNHANELGLATRMLREPCRSRLVIAHPYVAAHGWRAPFDRIVWIGDDADAGSGGVYEQAMSRGDMPWGTPAKLRYKEHELFL